MNQFNISRRSMLVSTGGLVVGSGLLSGLSTLGQTTKPKDLIFRTTDPRNGEPELSKLVQHWITPIPHFYVRSHAPNPQINPSEFRLSIEGLVRRPLQLSLTDLQRLPQRTATATLTCAGNRRAEFNREGNVGGVQWEAGAIGNAMWGGIGLADVLQQAEVLEPAKHIWFEGLDEIPKGDGIIPFGGSIPIEQALMDDGPAAPLLATEMNDAPLTADHGFPLRAVVPGYIGARSVKWLGKIVVSDRPSPNHYVATAYKIVKKADPIDWAESGPIYRYPINAAICTPERNAEVKAGAVTLSGYALPTGRMGSQITNVLVKADNGKTWTKAQLTGANQEFCWRLWQATVQVNTETKRLTVRATDSSGGFMPGRVPWNAKGYLQNSWYGTPIRVS